MLIVAVNKAVVNYHFKRGGESMANRDIKLAIAGAGLTQYQVADALGWSESGFSRKLRRELPAEEREAILEIVDKLKKESEV